jgi:hypothetical protein
MAIMKTALLVTALASLALGDGVSGQGQTGYGVPTGGYGPPTATGYEQQVGYDYDQQGYESQAAVGGDDLGTKLAELIPLFIAVFAAIILAQLLAPLLLQLLGLLVGILPMALSIKAPIVNAILLPFNLGLCDITNPAAPMLFTGRSFDGRALQEAVSVFGLDVSEAKMNVIADLVERGIESFTSTYTE